MPVSHKRKNTSTKTRLMRKNKNRSIVRKMRGGGKLS